MTTREDFAPISSKTAGDILALLGELRSIPAYRTRADALCTQLGESLAIAGEHRSHFEMMCMELLEGVGRATGRALSTVASISNVKAALEALEHTMSVLGSNVVELRAPTRETHIEAATHRALAEATPQLSAILIVDGRRFGDPLDMFDYPPQGQLMLLPGSRCERIIVRQVCRLSARVAELHTERTWPVPSPVRIAQVAP